MARRKDHRPWWSQWPAALLLGLGSFTMVLTGVIPLFLFALLTGPDTRPSGTEYDFEAGPGIGLRIAYVALCLAFLTFPVITVRFARRRLLGFLLLALIASSAVMLWGLAMFGIV
ncbi:hypothetical protein LKO27_12085 [Tessaracoccus sp. OS52]|uniref:hypothetical protein n=1 Tax=Tessaracoccus sp. OS52 TaxID=2886691 RepID=UPI001D124288|nr:hypothetical protein [Tessaracoccus sp. OS52]MCC2594146.1 hypothetical protein [Tessaracoccus sp. OS52]